MARHDTFTVPVGIWTQLTDANATAVRVQNKSGGTLQMLATNGAVAPADMKGSLDLEVGQTLAADLTLAQLWPGVAGANRLWGWAERVTLVSVSHADA